MQHEAVLTTLSEVSIVFAGFAGVVGALNLRNRTAEVLGQRYQAGAMVGFSLIAALFSLLPLILDGAGLSELAAWRTSSVALAAALFAWTALGRARMRALAETGLRLPERVALIMNSITGVAVLVLIGGGVGLLDAAGAYIACVFLPLVYAAFFFLRAFLSADRSGGPDAATDA
ncbi:MAG: hypothetical protein QNK05_25530 [Myxococcota bacterium]|nr:hypothetical protein [Myxococcota bacterium]